jgi:hypothetical protein
MENKHQHNKQHIIRYHGKAMNEEKSVTAELLLHQNQVKHL